MTLLTGRNWVLPCTLVLTFACANEGSSNQTATSSNPVTSAEPPPSANAMTSTSAQLVASAMPKPHFRHPGVVGTLVATSREQGDLKDDQKTKLDGIEEELNPKEQADRGKEARAIHDAVIEGVKAGKIDTTKITPLYADMDKAWKDRQANEAKALGELHDLLEPAQRTAVVKSLKDRQAKRDEMQKQRDANMAKDKPDPAKVKERDTERSKRRLEMLTRQLGLDADQQKKAEPIMAAKDKPFSPDAWKAKAEEGKKRMDAVLTAFEKDKFDATKLDLGAAPSKGMKEHVDRDIAYLNALLPVLKPDQKEKLAGSISRGRGPMGMGPMGPMGGPGGPGSMPPMGPMGPGGPGGPGMRGPMPGRPGFGGPMMREPRSPGFGFPLEEEPPMMPGGED